MEHGVFRTGRRSFLWIPVHFFAAEAFIEGAIRFYIRRSLQKELLR